MPTQTISFAPGATPISAQSGKWSVDAVMALLELPLLELIFRAQLAHREHFSAIEIQLSTLLSIKTGGCTENCSYCSQSMHNENAMASAQARSVLLDTDSVSASAVTARAAGATRFCMGAAWRQVRDGDLAHLTALIRTVRDLGMETCLTAGMLKPHQAAALQEAGLDYYNHNLDTSPEIYGDIVSTRTYQDRLDTLAIVHHAGLKTCSGGIVGLGESRRQRADLIAQLANLDPYPHSVPINQLVRVVGTPLQDVEPLDPLEVVRVVAATRISMPKAWVRLSAGRQALGDLGQTLCFLAGANAIFYGDRLLTTDNPDFSEDQDLFERLGLRATRLTA